MTNKIGWGQLGIILALSRIFSEAANFPSDDINYGMQRFTVIVLSYLLLGVMLIPVFMLTRKGDVAAVYGESRTAAVIVVIYLVSAAVITATRLQFYAASTIFDAAPPWLIILFASIVTLYGIFKGISAVTRTGVIAAAGFLVLLITVVVGIAHDIRPEYLYPALADNSSTLFGEVLSEFSKNAEVVIFAAVCSDIRKTAVKSIYVWFPVSLIVLLLMTFLYNTVLGEYLDSTNFPFYTLASLSDISVLQRLDGLDVVIWLMAAVIKLSLLMLAVYSLILRAFHNRKAALMVSGGALGVTALAAFYFSVNTMDFLAFSGIIQTGIPLITAGFVIPLIIAVKNRKEKKHAAV